MQNVTDQRRALFLSTVAFATCFAIWTIFSIIGLQIKQNLGLNNTEFGLLTAAPVLTGAISRIFLGIWTDRFGGRIIFPLLMFMSAASTWGLTHATTYLAFLFAALGVGLAGGSFAIGVAYVARFYPKERQGTVLGIFGVGNVGAAITHFCAPFLLIAAGLQGVASVYAIALFLMAVLFFIFAKTDPVVIRRKELKEKAPSFIQEIEPLKKLQVWRFSLYYFFTFGGFVALALWLPRYYVGTYGLSFTTAGMLSALYTFPTSVFRAMGGWLSDKVGARKVMYWMFIVSLICTFILSYPATDYIVHGVKGNIHFSGSIGLVPFVMLTFILGVFMSFGSAAIYKHIPVYYPNYIGPVGGIVGLIGALGGFFLPILFGIILDVISVWTSCFMVLFAIVAVSLTWMHFAIIRLEKARHPDLREHKFLPELEKNNPRFGS